MTITIQPARNEYTANASQTVFNYTFKIFENTDLNVYITPVGQAADDSTDLTVAYTVTGLGDEDGGTIILTIGTGLNELVTIVSNIPSERTIDYQNNGDFRPETVNNDFDRVVSIAKKIEDNSTRSVLLEQSQQGSKPLSLPRPVAGLFLRWKGDLTGLENIDITEDIPVTIKFPIRDLVADYGAKGDAVYQYELDGSVTVTSGTDDTQSLLNAMVDFALGEIGALTVPDGNFWIDSSQIDTPTGTTIIGAGSEATKFIMSTTTPNLNLFVGFYQDSRVSNLSFSGFKIIGSKVNDNTIGGTGIFTLGADGVIIDDVHSEGSKGLAWLGHDVAKLHGTTNAFLTRLKIDSCTLFSIYIRGVENPEVGFDPANETNNIHTSGLIIRNSNVGFTVAEGRVQNWTLSDYDCKFTDNLIQIEACDIGNVSNSSWSNATSNWSAATPTPFKEQWQIAGSSNISFSNVYIDAQLQVFGFGTSDVGCDNISFANLTTGNFWRCTTLNVQNDPDQFKGLFSNWNWTNCSFVRPAATFFQSDVGDQSSPEIAYWRDWGFSNCSWTNNSTNNPIVTVAVMGSLVFDDKCTFSGKPPRALKATNITFNATVRANGISGSSTQFTAVDGLDPLEPKTLRVGGNWQIEGEGKDVGFDVTNLSVSVDSRNASLQCWTSDAIELNDSGTKFKGFTGSDGLVSATIGTYKSLVVDQLPSIAGKNTFMSLFTGNAPSSQNIVSGADYTINGGMSFIKILNASFSWFVSDTERGVNSQITFDTAAAETTHTTSITSFNNNGVSIGSFSDTNISGNPYIIYQLLKVSGFLDIVPDVGNATNKTIAHSLGTDVGCIFSFNRDISSEWAIQYHTFNTASGAYIDFNTNGVLTDSTVWNDTPATSTEFSVGTSNLTNGNTNNIIHYLFAKNICHSYLGNGTTTNEINFGYKSKLILAAKRVTGATVGNFNVFDNVRDTSPNFSTVLSLNTSDIESTIASAITITDTGIIINTADSELNAAGSSYILIAIPEI